MYIAFESHPKDWKVEVDIYCFKCFVLSRKDRGQILTCDVHFLPKSILFAHVYLN